MVGDLLQPTHLIFVLLVALLVLGPKRLPEVGRSLGRGLRDFKDAMSGLDHDDPALTSPPGGGGPPPAGRGAARERACRARRLSAAAPPAPPHTQRRRGALRPR